MLSLTTLLGGPIVSIEFPFVDQQQIQNCSLAPIEIFLSELELEKTPKQPSSCIVQHDLTKEVGLGSTL